MQLVRPSSRYRDSFLEAVDEFQAEGLSWWSGPAIDLARNDFDAFVAAKIAEARTGSQHGPAKTHLWAVVDGEFVGRIAIFHELTPELSRSGGHIGYDTRPSFRRRGLATQMLEQALLFARDLGLERVLLTCDRSDVASIKVIERNGGVCDPGHALSAGKAAFWIALNGPEDPYKRQRARERMAALDQLAQLSQDYGGYDELSVAACAREPHLRPRTRWTRYGRRAWPSTVPPRCDVF